MNGSTEPLRFSVDRAVGDRDRLSVGLRVFYAIPILVIASVIGGGTVSSGNGRSAVATAGGLLVAGPALMIVFRQKYPRWWFDWNLAFLRFENRVAAYLLLLRDEYPSTDEEQAVHLDIAYPDVPTDLNRWLPLVKWFLAIPHYIVLFFLGIATVFVVVAAWFSILFTGVYPPAIADFVEGVMRWHNRVIAYAFLLANDEYPPFRLAP